MLVFCLLYLLTKYSAITFLVFHLVCDPFVNTEVLKFSYSQVYCFFTFVTSLIYFYYFFQKTLKDFIYLFIFRARGREQKREGEKQCGRETLGCLSHAPTHAHPHPGVWPTTQACHRTSDHVIEPGMSCLTQSGLLSFILKAQTISTSSVNSIFFYYFYASAILFLSDMA